MTEYIGKAVMRAFVWWLPPYITALILKLEWSWSIMIVVFVSGVCSCIADEQIK